MKTIKYFTKSVYGRELEYIIDATDAKMISNLTGRKTLEPQDRVSIEALTDSSVKFERVLKPN